MTSPRDLLDPSRHDQFGKGKLTWVVPARFGGMRARAQDRLLWEVRGALLQHELARSVNAALGAKERETRDAFAKRLHYDLRRLGDVLRGEVHVAAREAALALRGLGPSGLPDPSVAQASVRRAGHSARHVPGLKPGVLLRTEAEPPENTADAEAVMVALGETGGITVLPELTAEQEAAYARNAELAPPLVEQAVKTLRNKPDVLSSHWDPDGDDNDIRIRAAYEMAGGRPLAVGGPDDRGSSISVYLAGDWCTRVHDAGLAVVDGWFLLDVGGYGPDGRPTTALALDLAPENGLWTRDENGRLAEDDWEHVARPAALSWDEHSKPHIDGSQP